MSLQLSMQNALSALQVNQKSVEVATHNVANAHTEGYSRQEVQRETRMAGTNAGGVQIADILRTVDSFVQREVRTESGALQQHRVTSRYLGFVEQAFGTLSGDSTVAAGLADLQKRIESLTVEPESPTRRLALIDQADRLAHDINTMSNHLNKLMSEVDTEIASAAGRLDDHLRTIEELNVKIAKEQARGNPRADLLDQRDRALDAVAEIVDVRYFERATGEVTVYTSGGALLVDHDAVRVGYDPVGTVDHTTTFGPIEAGGQDITNSLVSGELKALVDMRDRTLVGIRDQFDAFSEKLRDQMNAAHNRGSSVPPSPTLQGSRTFDDVSIETVTLSDDARIAVLDEDGVIQAHHDVPAGTYTVQNLTDAISAAMPGHVTATTTNGGPLTIAATAAGHGIAVTDLAGGPDMTVTHDDGSGPRTFSGFSNFFGLNDMFVTAGSSPGAPNDGIAGTIRVRDDLKRDPSLVTRATLDRSTGPGPIDGTTVGLAKGDQSALVGIAKTLDETVAFGSVGSLPSTEATLVDYAGQIVGLTAQQANAAEQRKLYHENLVTSLKDKAGAISGVSVDEEMANLMTFQSAYAAAARALTAVDEMLQTLLRSV